MTGRLADRVIVVTGATGIAAASAMACIAEGASIFVISRREAACASLVEDLKAHGGNASYAVADLTDESETETAFANAVDTYAAINGVLAVAGGSGRRFGDGPLHELSHEAWRATNVQNGDPSFLTAREAVRAMQADGGSLVIVSSVLATSPSPGLFATHAYTAAKGGQLALVTSLAAYYAQNRIRVNGLAPALIATPMSARAADDPETMDYIARKQPLADGMVPASAVADAAVFLLADESAFVTGQVIAVDGGWSVTEA